MEGRSVDPGFRSASELAAAIRDFKLGSLELLEHYLERIDRLNPAINAVVAQNRDAARERAGQADAALARGELWGPLHGLPITIKDSVEVAGMPATSGAPELKDHMPARDAASVAKLREAGAVIFGKTNLPLYAGDFQSYNEVYGTTNNPWDLERGPGGSSGGSAAALAAGLTALELGSDIGGSIRNPAHFCGVYGHKPSHGLVPFRGHIPGPPGALSTPDLAVLGPLARSAQDLELSLDALAGPDEWNAHAWRVELPPSRRDRLADFRVAAWPDDPLGEVDAEVAICHCAAFDALRAAGVDVDENARPEMDMRESDVLYQELLYGAMAPSLTPELRERFEGEVKDLAPEDRSGNANMVRGSLQEHARWLANHEARMRLRAVWADFFRDFDVLLCPISPTAAFPHDHGDIETRTLQVNGKEMPYLRQVFWAGPATVVYLPATVAPVGLTRSGLPVGLQIVGPYLEDRTPLRFAQLLADVIGGFSSPPGF